jgi:hypothetical protein
MGGAIVFVPQIVGNSTRDVAYWSSDGGILPPSVLTPLVAFGSTGVPTDVTNQLGLPSGIAPVTGAFTGTGYSAAFTPQPGRDINVTLTGSNYVGVTIQLLRSFDSGATKLPLTINSLPWAVYTGPVSEIPWNEPESGVEYFLWCSAFTSATAQGYRISH